MFAVFALGLAVIGLYGVVSYAVAARTREIGVRMALGASVVGLALSLLVSRLLGDLLVGTRPTDLMAFVGAPLVLGATAVLAFYTPARRASRADPVAALRAE